MGKHSQLDAETNGASLAPFMQHTSRDIMSSANSAILTDELGYPDRNTGNRGLWKDTNTVR